MPDKMNHKLLTNTVNQNCPEFVILNKQETFIENALDKVKDFGKKGFYFCFFIIFVFLLFLFHLFYGIYDPV